jgi:hypothetical protein
LGLSYLEVRRGFASSKVLIAVSMSFYAKTFTEDEWAEVSKEIPQEDDAFLRKYVEGREALISQENQRRSGTSVSS